MEVNGLTIELRPMIFIDQLTPVGFLDPSFACQACWYFYILAENGRAAWAGGIENQIIEHDATGAISNLSPEMPLWMDRHYNAQAKSVAILYGLESPDSMWSYWPNVAMEAHRLGMVAPRDEYRNCLTGRDRIT